MKYAIWEVYFAADSNEGSTPDPIIRERGYDATGLFHISTFTILGCVSDDADLSNLDDYKVQEITNDKALEIALTLNNTAHLDDNGDLSFAPELKV
jgi:hypothetical protein